MATDPEDLQRRLHNAQEVYDTELKSWQDPKTDWGRATIAKACMALRNNNGGFLIIGIKDDGSCDKAPNWNVRSTYTQDTIQEIVSKFSSEPFQITLHFVERDGIERVMIEVPAGVRNPVVCRNNIPKEKTDKHEAGSLLADGTIYVRTLNSNGRVSTSPVKTPDWGPLMDHCLNNREADIGGFLRRQLSGIDIGALAAVLTQSLHLIKAPTSSEVARKFLSACHSRFTRAIHSAQNPVPDCGTRECSAVISGEFPHPELYSERRFVTGLHSVHFLGEWFSLELLSLP